MTFGTCGHRALPGEWAFRHFQKSAVHGRHATMSNARDPHHTQPPIRGSAAAMAMLLALTACGGGEAPASDGLATKSQTVSGARPKSAAQLIPVYRFYNPPRGCTSTPSTRPRRTTSWPARLLSAWKAWRTTPAQPTGRVCCLCTASMSRPEASTSTRRTRRRRTRWRPTPQGLHGRHRQRQLGGAQQHDRSDAGARALRFRRAANTSGDPSPSQGTTVS